MAAKERSRARIIITALRLAASPSGSALRMQTLAAEAGVGRATLYRYYPTLDAVVTDAMAYWAISTAGKLRQLDLPQHPQQRMYRVFEGLVAMLVESRPLLQAFLPTLLAAQEIRVSPTIPKLDSLIPVALAVALGLPESALPPQTTRLLQYALLAGAIRLAADGKQADVLCADLCAIARPLMLEQVA